MAVFVSVANPDTLIKRVTQSVRSRKMRTWGYFQDDETGTEYYYHDTKSGQWEGRVYIRPLKVKAAFFIVKAEGCPFDRQLFAAVQGRWVAALVSHILTKGKFIVSAGPEGQDSPLES